MATRRMGRKDSATSNALLDATERVLHDDGYGAATSRRIAEAAGVRQQLVYYYFQTMDELLLATFQRRTERALTRLREDVATELPLRALWKFLSVTANGRLGFEFMALANHHDGIRDEIARYVTEARRISADAIERQMKASGAKLPIKPEAAAFFLDSASLLLRREEGSGISIGHREAVEFMDWALDQIGGPDGSETPPKPAAGD